MLQTINQSPTFSRREMDLKIRLQFTVDINKIFKSLDSAPETTGAGVIFIDKNNTSIRLREFTSSCHMNPISVIIREPPQGMPATEYAEELQVSVRESKLVGELLNTTLSCSSAILGWIVVFGSLSVVPITGGASSAVTYIGVTAATASSLQCFNGLARSVTEYSSPNTLDQLDGEAWYQNTNKALDWISLGGAAVSGAYTIKSILTLSVTTGKSIPNILKGLNRQERLKLTNEVNRLNLPNISNKAFKQLVSSGEVARRYSQKQISDAILLQMKDAIGASIGITGSSTIQALAIALYEEQKNES